MENAEEKCPNRRNVQDSQEAIGGKRADRKRGEERKKGVLG